jgi:glycopeptide antibiotics resistance protein
MKKRLVPAIILIAYVAFLVPFKTILPYLLGHKGLIIAGINLVGNIAVLVPFGFLLPLAFRNMTWKKSAALAAVVGLAIESMQAALRVGIFDIDDVILNALGVMVGYWTCVVLLRWVRARKYRNIAIATALTFIAIAAAAYAVQRTIPDRSDTMRGTDLCGGTGGIGEIISAGNGTIMLMRNDGRSQVVRLSSGAEIRTPAGRASESDLRAGDRVTLVGDAQPDGSFDADVVLVCAAS